MVGKGKGPERGKRAAEASLKRLTLDQVLPPELQAEMAVAGLRMEPDQVRGTYVWVGKGFHYLYIDLRLKDPLYRSWNNSGLVIRRWVSWATAEAAARAALEAFLEERY